MPGRMKKKNWEVGKMYGYQWVNWEKYIEEYCKLEKLERNIYQSN